MLNNAIDALGVAARALSTSAKAGNRPQRRPSRWAGTARWTAIELIVAVVAVAAGAPANAQSASSPPEDVASSAEPQQPQTPQLFSLGDFHVREVRQTRNETIDVRFSLYLLLPPEANQEMLARLQHRLQRLRDQIIVAVRLTETIDFIEPGLNRMQQIMRIRVKRELGPGVIDGLYVNDFILGDN